MGKPARKVKDDGFTGQVKSAKAKLTVVKRDVVKVAKKVDQKAHKQPWLFVAVAAMFSAVFGLFLGKRTKKS